MSDLPSPDRFPTTQWSLVYQAGKTAGRDTALVTLLNRYLPSLEAHLKFGRGLSRHDAEDVLQSFVLDKIIHDRLITHADERRGRFRTFLLSVFDNYLSNWRRNGQTQRRSPGTPLASIEGGAEPSDSTSLPSQSFDLAWARALLAETLRRMRQECEEKECLQVWTLFELRVVEPTLNGRTPVNYEQAVARCGFTRPADAYNSLVTAKRMFARLLRSVVAEYARDEREIDEELRDLQTILAQKRA